MDKSHKEKKRIKDKSHRATCDAVLDNRTRNILAKLIKRGALNDLTGCISAGKEANVYTGYISLEHLSCKLINNYKNQAEIQGIDNVCESITPLQSSSDDDNQIKPGREFNLQSLLNSNIESQKEDVGKYEKELNTMNVNLSSLSQQLSDVNLSVTEEVMHEQINLHENIFGEEQCEIQNSLYLNNDIFTHYAPIPCAIKIYQTSIMQFKDRIKYIQSEKRFDTFCNTNPRKLVKLWAEKEVRNLKRLNKHNIPSPVPLYLKKNILVMSLITNNSGNAAPRLKDAVVNDYQVIYHQSMDLIDAMYNKCGLIHSDLSEYNILCVDDFIFIIDMGQAVEKSHDNADEFLIKDILNISNYFRRKGCDIYPINQVFENVTGKTIPFCLREIDISPGISIPCCIGEVSNAEDLSGFLKTPEENSYVRQEKDQEPVKTRDERRAEKVKVKEEQKEKRRNKIPKKEKNKLKKLKANRR